MLIICVYLAEVLAPTALKSAHKPDGSSRKVRSRTFTS